MLVPEGPHRPVLRILLIPPRQAGLHQFAIPYSAIRQDHIADGPAILIMAKCFHGHVLAKGELGGELLGTLTERLPFLGTIDAVEPNLFGSPLVQN